MVIKALSFLVSLEARVQTEWHTGQLWSCPEEAKMAEEAGPGSFNTLQNVISDLRRLDITGSACSQRGVAHANADYEGDFGSF